MLLPLRNEREKIIFLLKKIFCIFLVYSGICRLFSFIHRNSVKVLVYHGIVNADLSPMLNREGLHLQLESFERQMAYLKKRYHILDLNEFINYLKEDKPVPKYSVVVTFDDGYKNNYENLKNIVLKYKIPATIFLVTDYVGTSQLLWLDKLEMAFFKTKRKGISALQSIGIEKIQWRSDQEKIEKYLVLKNYLKKMTHEELQRVLKNIFSELVGDKIDDLNGHADIAYAHLLNYDEVKELTQYGVRFGSHTCNHEILTALSEKDVKDTLKRSFLRIKDCGQDDGIAFAYPNGSFNNEIKQVVAEAGYNCALTTIHGFNARGCDLYALKRNEIGNNGDMHIFIATLSGALDFIKSFAGAC